MWFYETKWVKSLLNVACIFIHCGLHWEVSSCKDSMSINNINYEESLTWTLSFRHYSSWKKETEQVDKKQKTPRDAGFFVIPYQLEPISKYIKPRYWQISGNSRSDDDSVSSAIHWEEATLKCLKFAVSRRVLGFFSSCFVTPRHRSTVATTSSSCLAGGEKLLERDLNIFWDGF